MSSEALYEYNDDGDYLLKIQKCRQHDEDSAYANNAEVSIDGRTCCLPPSQRQAAAKALAGDEYRVVPTNVPHGCQWTDDPDDPCPVCGQKLPEWERELLAREAQAWQPDRPEPVDPWDVATGDVVDYERLPSFKTCCVVGEVQETFSDQDTSWSLRIHGTWWNASPDVATVRVLHRPEPEPDEAAVVALADALVGVGVTSAGPDALGYARALIRHRNVQVVSTDE